MKKSIFTSLVLCLFSINALAQSTWPTTQHSQRQIRMYSVARGTMGNYTGFNIPAPQIHPDSSLKPKPAYNIWVKTYDSKRGPFGLYQTMDSSLVISRPNKWQDGGITLLDTIYIKHIESVQIRKKEKPVKGVFIGILIGAASGALIGYIIPRPCKPSPGNSFDDCTSRSALGPRDSALAGMALGVLSGAIIGGLGGSERITYTFQRENSLYNQQREKLKKISITGR